MTKLFSVRCLPRWTLLLLSALLCLPSTGCITLACLALTGGRGTGCGGAAQADIQIAGAVVHGAAAAAFAEAEDGEPAVPVAVPPPPPVAPLPGSEEPRLPPPPFHPPPPVPAPPATELSLLRTAEGHLAAGRYPEALAGSYAVAMQGTQQTTAWLLVGLSACKAQEQRRAQEAWDHLRPESPQRSLVERTCAAARLRLPAA